MEGNPPRCRVRRRRVSESFLFLWFKGIVLETASRPAEVALGDYPSAKQQPSVAAAESERLSVLGTIHWYPRGGHPPDLRVSPSQLIVESDKVRLVDDWSD